MLIKEKVNQAIDILKECSIDCWITFVRESEISHDPALDFLVAADVTWHSAFIITSSGETCAIIGQGDRKNIEDLGIYSQVLSYQEGIRKQFVECLNRINPSSIALNYSKDSEICDGLTHGMYLNLVSYLSEIGFAERVVSSEKIISALRARKTDYELSLLRKAIKETLEIFKQASSFIKAGRTEIDVADFIKKQVDMRGLGLAWDPKYCPGVFTGPETAGAHYRPTERRVERGHVINIDFGVRSEGYCSDLQRTFYIEKEGEDNPPEEVRKGFETIVAAIELARSALKPGAKGYEVDKVARDHLVSEGYKEFPHGLGHQIGRFAHDGTALLGPPWEKYGKKPFEIIEKGMVFTIEPRLAVPGRGIVTIEEMVVVTDGGAEYLSTPQKELIIIK